MPSKSREERNLQMKLWRQKHPEWKLKKYSQRLPTTINGKHIYIYGIEKRPKIENCELCGKKKKKLGYHHWMKERPNIGIWVCSYCHCFCERADHGFLEIYLRLKEKLTPLPEKMGGVVRE